MKVTGTPMRRARSRGSARTAAGLDGRFDVEVFAMEGCGSAVSFCPNTGRVRRARLDEGQPESVREGAIGTAGPDVAAPARVEPVALDHHDAEPGQRLAAPAHGRAVAVRAPGVVDLEPEQLVRPREDGLDLV